VTVVPRALVIDDDGVNRKILSMMLQGAGFAVTTAGSALEGLQAADAFVPDVILLDVEMPDHDGYWACLRFKENDATAAIPILFISAREGVEDKVRAFANGGADFITKPFRKEEVLARVQAHVRIRQLMLRLSVLNDELSEKQRQIDEDLAAAAEVQRRLLVPPTAVFTGLDVASFYEPSALIGGDVFNVAGLPDGRVAIYIIDVSGHGIAAALLTFAVCQELNSASSLLHKVPGISPAAVAAELDRHFPIELYEKYFTFALAILDPRTGSLEYTVGGHPPPLLQKASGELHRLDDGGPAAGLGLGQAFTSTTLMLNPGDRLVFYTDGVCDQPGLESNFGLPRLESAVQSSAQTNVTQLVANLIQDLRHFRTGTGWSDDVAVCAVEFRPEPSPRES